MGGELVPDHRIAIRRRTVRRLPAKTGRRQAVGLVIELGIHIHAVPAEI